MDATNVRDRLIGDEQERAVSPVIGVILMVAITVILAAVIAAFVLDLGGSVGQEAQAAVSIDVDHEADAIQVEVTSMGNADHVNLSSSNWDTGSGEPDNASLLTVGDTVSYTEADDLEPAGTISAIAVINESETETQVASEDWEF
ncbi:type IV pilin [Natrialba swarupiae]|uniref:Type IV pilin n=1 Tax=Natrialba swarupiae TaxID=2448032 RepID=A0A5D5AK62_9EURY|nr:type IV pilin N-terminal domain-containing protein [Natrialba swarupiae]MCW8172875.1 type IV pilin [Natrialba swarupiae]TYT61564.1 type IV pilin [Natrialba swarupiae]